MWTTLCACPLHARANTVFQAYTTKFLHARARGVYWEGSALEALCIEQQDQLQFRDLTVLC